MTFLESQLLEIVGQYFLPLIRLAAFFLAAPIFGTRVISARIRVVLAVAITILIVPLLPDVPVVTDVGLATIILVVQESIIGFSLGFILQVLFQLFVLAGQYIAMKMGLGFASMNDPANGVSVTIVSQFYLLTTTLLFISFNGHLVMIDMLVKSFSMLPIASGGMSIDNIYRIVLLGSWMFGSALTIALPVLTALLVVNIAFGVMSRSAPQMNIFAVGFPITLLFGLMIMWVSFPSFLSSFEKFLDEGLQFTLNIIKLNNG